MAKAKYHRGESKSAISVKNGVISDGAKWQHQNGERKKAS
jgi:hypothetical protein